MRTILRSFIGLRTAPPFDLSQFNDPVAMKAGWMPAVRGGMQVPSRKLVEVSPNRVELPYTADMQKLLVMVAVVVGFAAFIFLSGIVGAMMPSGVPPYMGVAVAAIGSVALVALAVVKLRQWILVPIVLDRTSGSLSVGAPPKPGSPPDPDRVQLATIHAVQIVGERVYGNKRYYTSYELNLVQRDGRRINLMDHAQLQGLRADAEKLARFLNVRVWDASGLGARD